jgi:PPOX class probable FMN-dependent enzyme
MTSTETVKANRFADTFGYPTGRAVTKVKDYMTSYVQEFISHSPFVVMASSDSEGHTDASPKGGKPGFVRVLDERHLLLPDVAGNKLFQSYQNMDDNPHVGLVFFIPGLADVVRINGRVIMVNREELDRHDVEHLTLHPDGNRGVQQGIVVEVDESFGHCPRALNYSDFWNMEEIQRRKDTYHRASVRKPNPATTPQPTTA